MASDAKLRRISPPLIEALCVDTFTDLIGYLIMNKLIRNFFLLFLSLLLCSCIDSESNSESSNQQLIAVNTFLEAVTSSDIETMERLLAEDFIYTWVATTSSEISPSLVTEGRDTYLQPFRTRENSANSSNLSMNIIQSTVIGNTILQERIDTFNTPGGPLIWHTSSFFLVIDGKIHSWGDYEWP
jgi:limonene-1,2-epoxide hydrolase